MSVCNRPNRPGECECQLLGLYERPGVGGAADNDVWMMPREGDRTLQPFGRQPQTLPRSGTLPDRSALSVLRFLSVAGGRDTAASSDGARP